MWLTAQAYHTRTAHCLHEEAGLAKQAHIGGCLSVFRTCASRPQCAKSQRDVLVTAHSLTNGPSWRGGGGRAEGKVCILRPPGIAASPNSLLPMGRACGRRLTAWKILFTGRQTCSFYLVLWLCGSMPHKRTGRKGWKFSRPECATSQESACSLANDPSWGGGGGGGGGGEEEEACILHSPGIAASPISLLLWEESVGEA